ncbi:hypothetical protein DASC09_030980 [Saccharomycopsis crataegensis]|uniref:Uncharacterized protein n=1 Tax=Saccharomycopsis crataegensis TaxID=43959 RepID=A0AAV5QNN6_9ASCO|nr:hypothetical protein DASC09_030980 [Saccharomycopsis crataegensis]
MQFTQVFVSGALLAIVSAVSNHTTASFSNSTVSTTSIITSAPVYDNSSSTITGLADSSTTSDKHHKSSKSDSSSSTSKHNKTSSTSSTNSTGLGYKNNAGVYGAAIVPVAMLLL